MVIKVRQLLAITILAVFTFALLALAMENASYAKGVTKTEKSSPNFWGSANSRANIPRPTSNRPSISTGWNSNRFENSRLSSSYRGTASWGGTSFNSSSTKPFSPGNPVFKKPSSSTPKDSGWSPLSISGRWELRSSTTQRDKQSVNFSSNNSSNGSTRKEYSSIGKIWSSRTEKRDTSLDRERKRERTETHKYKRDDYNPYIISYSTRRFFYPNYCYTYRKDYCWPSIYFYYGTLPPYIFGPRIVFIPTFANRHICVQIPIAINWNDDYYLCDTYGRRLREALNRIQRAWERGDEYLIRDYLRFNSRIAVYLNGKYAYSIDAEDYYDMTRDAMRNIRTRSFIFDRIHKRSSDCVVAFGTHIYVDEDSGFVKTVYVSYTLERFGSDWYITEVGCSTSYPW